MSQARSERSEPAGPEGAQRGAAERSQPKASVRWLDSHCHLTADEFAEDRKDVLERAFAAGVEALVAIGSGYGVERNARAVALAAADPRVFATAGVHPHEASELDDAGRAKLCAWLSAPRVVAVGECGLDYHYLRSPREVQREVLAEQLALARERGLPVSLHVRGAEPDAFAELLDLWRAEGRGEIEGVLHCYTGTLEFARRAVAENLYVSFSGILTFKRDGGLREVARALPLERLLVETDAPLLAPEGFRGRRNEPARVAVVGGVLAAARGAPPEEVALATTRNARALFRLGEGG
jgi:TatD DNase family protein